MNVNLRYLQIFRTENDYIKTCRKKKTIFLKLFKKNTIFTVENPNCLYSITFFHFFSIFTIKNAIWRL